MKVLFAASECYPFIKTGGLGDVTYALPRALRDIGIDMRPIIPKYSSIPDEYKNNMYTIATFNVPVGWRNQYCSLQALELDGLTYYFIDNEYYFKRAEAYSYYDDGERFAFFSRALLEAINYMGDFSPDILQCNDWHTAIALPILSEHFKYRENYSKLKTIFTIHNLRYQGIFKKEMLSELLCLNDSYFSEDKLKYYDCINFMKGGLIYSDAITTVSESYVNEIKYPYYGEGLHGLLYNLSYKTSGILNGIDYNLFNPEIDTNIEYNYNVNSLYSKTKNKTSLQAQLNLKVDENVPMISIISRLVDQKGLDLVACVLKELLNENIQLVVLGTGDRKYEDLFKFYQWKYPDKVSANITFSNCLAQKIYASSDMFLMPSQFEPCGLGQMIALRYGSIPIVRETGGLKDTVNPFNKFTGEGNGFSFSNYNAHDMLYTIQNAIHFYYNKDIWNKLINSAMNSDNSWKKSAEKYSSLYYKLLNN